MKIEFDPAKRAATLDERGIDFADAAMVFSGTTIDLEDDRFSYGEKRIVTIGHLHGRMVVIVWTRRGDSRRIISMRKANEREKERFGKRLGAD